MVEWGRSMVDLGKVMADLDSEFIRRHHTKLNNLKADYLIG